MFQHRLVHQIACKTMGTVRVQGMLSNMVGFPNPRIETTLSILDNHC